MLKMKYSFNCYGHENVTSKHKTTLEFTKDKDLSLQGDCIIGVKADFSLKELKKFIKNKENEALKKTIDKLKTIRKNSMKKPLIKIPIKIIIKINGYEEEINGYLNLSFNDSKEIVIRKSEFVSSRTLVISADKAACDISFKNKLNNPKNRIYIHLT